MIEIISLPSRGPTHAAFKVTGVDNALGGVVLISGWGYSVLILASVIKDCHPDPLDSADYTLMLPLGRCYAWTASVGQGVAYAFAADKFSEPEVLRTPRFKVWLRDLVDAEAKRGLRLISNPEVLSTKWPNKG